MSDEPASGAHLSQSLPSKKWPAPLIGLGVLLSIIELFIFAVHRDDHFYWLLFWLMLSGVPFAFAAWWICQCKEFPANTLAVILIGAAVDFTGLPKDCIAEPIKKGQQSKAHADQS